MSRVAKWGFLFSLVAGCVAFSSQGAAHVLDADSTRLNLIVSDIVYDATRDVIYASVDATDTNIRTRSWHDRPRFVDRHRQQVARHQAECARHDASGSALYVGIDGQGAVKKIALPDSPNRGHTRSGRHRGARCSPVDIAVMPGTTDTIAVSAGRGPQSEPRWARSIIDGGPARPTATPGHIGSNSITFGSIGRRVVTARIRSRAPTASTGTTWRPAGSRSADDRLGWRRSRYHDGLVYVQAARSSTSARPTTSIADTLTGGIERWQSTPANTVYYTEQGYGRNALDPNQAYDITTRVERRYLGTCPTTKLLERADHARRRALAYIDAEHRSTAAAPRARRPHERGGIVRRVHAVDARPHPGSAHRLGRGGLVALLGAGQTIDGGGRRTRGRPGHGRRHGGAQRHRRRIPPTRLSSPCTRPASRPPTISNSTSRRQ